MFRLIPHIAAAVVFLTAATVPSPAADPPSIKKLVEQLGSPSYPDRERATKALRERGPAALPALRQAAVSTDAEVRTRARSLIPALEIAEALLPKRVTIAARDTPLTDVLKELEKQSGQKVTAPGKDSTAPITVAAKDVPLWEALDRIGQAAGRVAAFQGHPPSLHLVPGTSRSPFVTVRGPFRLEATWFHEDRDIDLTDGGGWRSQRLTLAVSVLAEPRLTLLKVHPARVEEAIDSDGRSLVEPDEKEATFRLQKTGRGTFRGEHPHSADVRLRRGSATAKTARLIRGAIPVRAILIRRPVVVTSKVMEASGTSFKAGTDGLIIRQVRNQGGNTIEVEIQVPYEEGRQQREWHERFHVEDDAGNQYRMTGRGTSYNGREYRISMYFSPPFNNKKKNVGPPTKLVFEDWVVHEHAIPFEFRDVPLP